VSDEYMKIEKIEIDVEDCGWDDYEKIKMMVGKKIIGEWER
jgi:hypothetical protein